MTHQQRPVDAFIKIVLIGDLGVGKTSLLVRYTEEQFSETPMTSIGVDYKTKIIEVDNKRIELQLWDTAGQDRYSSLHSDYPSDYPFEYRNAHGILLVFDVTDGESYSRCTNWNREMEGYLYQRPNTIRYMVGNKIDDKDNRMISPEFAKELAENFEMSYIETSAKDNINVEEAFESIAREIMRGESFEEHARNVIHLGRTQPDSTKKQGCCYKI